MRARKLNGMVAWSAFSAVLSAPVIVWWVSVGDPGAYLSHDLPPGQALYIFSKLSGLLALFLFWGQCLLALAHRAPILRGIPPVGVTTHRRLGLLTFTVALMHVILFVIAASLRAGSPAWNLLIPNFTHGYYNSFVSLGVLAMWLLLLGVWAGWRTSRGYAAWKTVHGIWPVVFGLVFLHAFSIGSESRYGAMRYVLLLVATSFCAAGISRAYAAWRNKKPRGVKILDSIKSAT